MYIRSLRSSPVHAGADRTPVPRHRGLSRHHAVVIRGTAGAIVTVERDAEVVVTDVERFPYAVEPVVARVRKLKEADPDCSVVVDVEGLGDAAWMLLGSPDHRRGWRLYAKHGVERQELTRELVVAVARHAFTFAAGLRELDAVRKSLLTVTRDVREDGPGSELAVALSLALTDRRRAAPQIF